VPGASVATDLYRYLGAGIGATARLVGAAKKILGKTPTVRPGIGSAVTKGPLKVGGKVVYGKAGMSTAAKVVTGVGGGVGVATVASHRPRTQSAPAPRAPSPSRTSTSTDRKCCPAGTKRMVCFKRGKVKKKPHAQKPMAHRSRAKKARRGAVTAKQAAARKRFAAAARKGPIKKGTRI